MQTPSILSAIKKIRLLLTRKEKWAWAGIIAFSLCTSSLEVLTASSVVVLAQVLNQPELGLKYLNKIGMGSDLKPLQSVLVFALLCGVIYIFKNCVAAVEVFYQNFSIQRMNYRFKQKLLRRYADFDYAFYLTRNSSFGVSVVHGDTEQLFSIGMMSLANILSECIIFICLVSLVIYMNPTLAFFFFAAAIILVLAVTKGLLPMFYRWGQHLQEASLHCGKNLLQFFHAFKEIILLGKKDAFLDAYHMHSKRKARIHAVQAATNALPRIFLEVFFVALIIATISYLCLKYETPHQVMGILGGYLYVGFRMMPGLNRMIYQLNNFKSIIPSIERVYSEFTNIELKQVYLDSPSFSFHHSFEIKNAYFKYPGRNDDALMGINLSLKKGECVGIVGETGSGKSTLVDMILGLLIPHKGNLLVDGTYIPNCPKWHEKIGYVPQSIYLLDDSIKANIAFGETETQIDNQRLFEAIEAAQLNAFISKLPEGADTIVGERGMRLSGGERQRIAIARALYRKPEVLIFDEATSALDNETENKLMETISRVSKSRTVIMIAHRLTTLKDCDRIVHIKDGRITHISDKASEVISPPLQEREPWNYAIENSLS